MGHSSKIVALCLLLASITAITSFGLQPVYSQDYITTTSFLTKVTLGFTTSTSYVTAVSIGITSTSSVLTYITLEYVTSTSFLTFFDPTIVTTTNTYTYPAPTYNHLPATIGLTDYVIMSVLLMFFGMWTKRHAESFDPRLLRTIRKFL